MIKFGDKVIINSDELDIKNKSGTVQGFAYDHEEPCWIVLLDSPLPSQAAVVVFESQLKKIVNVPEIMSDLCQRAGFIQNEIDKNFDGNTVYGTTHNTALMNLIELTVAKCADAADHGHRTATVYPGDFIVEYFGFCPESGAAAWRWNQSHNIKKES